MAIYKLGSKGEEVRRIQQKLTELGLYQGPLDGDFGGGTNAAVIKFQKSKGLTGDGLVGQNTWSALFAEDIPKPDLFNQALIRKCLALTGTFETGKAAPECFCGLSGDFDGQGMSFGVLQWNFGQGSLQPLLHDMLTEHGPVMHEIFGPHFDAFQSALTSTSKDELLEFVRSVQHPVNHKVYEPWAGYAKALGRTAEFQEIQARHARQVYDRAIKMCQEYGLWSERAVALMFDICTQNGSINAVTRQRIQSEFKSLDQSQPKEALEQHKLEIVANRRAEVCNPRWVDDVRSRKLCIARGGGNVHGIAFDLEGQFGIGLRPF